MKINKGQFRFSKWDEVKFNYKRGKGFLSKFLLNRFRWHYYPRLHRVSKFPDHVDIEISSACNMQCPMCYTRTEEFKAEVGRLFMPFELFKKVIDECAKHNIFSIRISLRGEPFIHPEAIKMIKYAHDKGIKEISSLTNALALTLELFEKAMEAGLTWLTISVDGTGKTYESIRIPAKFDDVVEKIKKYKEIKDKKGSVKPVIKVQSIWPAIKDNAKEYYDIFCPYVDSIASNPLIDYLRKDENIEYESSFDCPVLYQRMVVGSNGLVLLCSNDEFGEYIIGDANKESLYDIWHGERIQKARDLHRKHVGYKEMTPCQKCYLPRKTISTVGNIGQKKVSVDKYTGRTEEIGQ
ncbi:MAG: radical SAM/SPASM domain-containing protein [Candidatus Nealsonbacteria bacterium]